MFLGGNHKPMGFSAKNKIQQNHGDGSQTIICMGQPFRVEKRLRSVELDYTRRRTKRRDDGTSFVYLVENSSHLEEFPMYLALKRVFFNVDQISEAHKEIGILSSIKDKNIVHVFHNEIVRSEGKISVSIAMEYCKNSLAKRISSTSVYTRLTEAEICHILFAITSALGYLHSQQPPIAHRDIRPENILINNNLLGPIAYKLNNFANATTDAYRCANREEATLATEDIEMHTNPAFRSPEMADPWSKRRICEKSDMWMLGVLLYYIMYLQLPFEPMVTASRSDYKLHFPFRTEESYTGSLRVIIEHLLDPNPETRWDVFTLTNFLRFTEDINCHLGIFCFTRTEFPEGWEEQEIKTINRTPPPKASFATRGKETRAITEQQRHAQASKSGQMADSTQLDSSVQEAMLALEVDGSLNGEELEQYRRMLIREQEEAWEQAKAAASQRRSTDRTRDPPEPTNTASTLSVEKDPLEDLFAGPTPAAVTAIAPVDSPGKRQEDLFRSDGIFGASELPAPSPFLQQQPVWSNTDGHFATGNEGAFLHSYPTAATQAQMLPNPAQQQAPIVRNVAGGENVFSPGGCNELGGMLFSQTTATTPMSHMNVDFLFSPSKQQQQQQPLSEGPTHSGSNKNKATKVDKKDPFAELLKQM